MGGMILWILEARITPLVEGCPPSVLGAPFLRTQILTRSKRGDIKPWYNKPLPIRSAATSVTGSVAISKQGTPKCYR